MKLRIFDVGRMKRSTEITVGDNRDADQVAGEIYSAVLKMKALMSRDVDCTWDFETRSGVVYAGGRRVGSVEEIPS